MAGVEQFESLRGFDPEVLGEIVREAELRLGSLLEIAGAADSRAMTLAGFQISGATASLGAGLIPLQEPHGQVWLSVLSLLFTFLMIVAALLAVSTLRPAKFHVPGNRPGNWLPDCWFDGKAHGFSLVQARLEQAACLETAIAENEQWIEWAAGRVRRSIDCMLLAVGIAGMMLLAWIAIRA